MTEDKDFKKKVRARMAKTGESYTAAKKQLQKIQGASLKGWHVTGPGVHSSGARLDYEGEIDPGVFHQGQPCAVLRATAPRPARGHHAVH